MGVLTSGPAAGVLLDHVSKSFGASRTAPAQQVLDDIHLDVAPGESVCLLGTSGCGKTTSLNLVAGLDRPTSGAVHVDGRPTLMFQDHALFPWLTAGRNVELALRVAGVSSGHRRARAEELLGLVHLSGTYGKRVHQLSGGMRQRVALARAPAQDSEVPLMDEPFAAPDAITRDLPRTAALFGVPGAVGGLDGVIEHPGTLSQGERQLLVLVRVYASPARVVILDEATCHLDPASEARAETAMMSRPATTLVVVAHRMSLVRRARRVLALEGGPAVQGGHAEVRGRSPLYDETVTA